VQQFAQTYWLYVMWDPLAKAPEVVCIQNPAVRLDHVKREIITTRFFEISADVVQQAATGNE
jgi:hypothetical protein